LALSLIGKGKVVHNKKEFSANTILKKFGWKPIKLEAKKRFSFAKRNTVYECLWSIFTISVPQTFYLADVIASISLDAFDGRIEPFHDLVH